MNWRQAVMNWNSVSWFLALRVPWFELPCSQCRRQFMHRRCNSWRNQFMPIGQFIACSLNEPAIRKANAIQEIKWIDGKPSWIETPFHDFSRFALHDLNCILLCAAAQFMAQPIHELIRSIHATVWLQFIACSLNEHAIRKADAI